MRRSIGVLTVVGLMLISTAAFAGEQWESYKDAWNSVSYSGNDGTLDWAGVWSEIGEADGPAAGAVHVDPDDRCADYKCLHIYGTAETESTIGVSRKADLSVFGEAEICYDITRAFDEAHRDAADAVLYVQVNHDGSWKTIDSFDLEATDNEPIHRSKGLGNFLTEGFAVRFVASGVLGGEVFIDNIEVKGELVPSSTSSTSSTTTTIKDKETSTTRPKPTTTTSRPTTTSTERPTTTTSSPVTTTSEAQTTTTVAESTTTTQAAVVVPVPLPPDSGIRSTDGGLMNDYDPAMFDPMDTSEVLGVEITADYRMAVEVIEAAWLWMLGLALVITAALLAGLDRRRTRLADV